MIENTTLTSYLVESYFLASQGGYIASSQMMSHDKLKHQVKGQFLSGDKFFLSHDITFISHWWLRYTMNGKPVDAAIDSFLL